MPYFSDTSEDSITTDTDDDGRDSDDFREAALGHAKKIARYHELAKQSWDAHRRRDAKYYSRKAKGHKVRREECFQSSAKLYFAENNKPSKVQDDEVDLHDLLPKEAKQLLEKWLRMRQGKIKGAHVIVGQGRGLPNFGPPLHRGVKELCDELGFPGEIEEGNPGRIWVGLLPVPPPPSPQQPPKPQPDGKPPRKHKAVQDAGAGLSGSAKGTDAGVEDDKVPNSIQALIESLCARLSLAGGNQKSAR